MIIYTVLWVVIGLLLVGMICAGGMYWIHAFLSAVGSCDADEYEREEMQEENEKLGEQMGAVIMIGFIMCLAILAFGFNMFGINILTPIAVLIGIYIAGLCFVKLADFIR